MRTLLLLFALAPLSALAQSPTYTTPTSGTTQITSSNVRTETRAATVKTRRTSPFKSARQIGRENRPTSVGRSQIGASRSAAEVACDNLPEDRKTPGTEKQCERIRQVAQARRARAANPRPGTQAGQRAPQPPPTRSAQTTRPPTVGALRVTGRTGAGRGEARVIRGR